MVKTTYYTQGKLNIKKTAISYSKFYATLFVDNIKRNIYEEVSSRSN